MAQVEPFNLYLGPAKTGVALGAIVYEADGTTVYAAFSTVGWYEEPDGTGDWHHPGVSFPEAGGVMAYGISGVEYRRVSIGAAPTGFATPTNVSDAQTAIIAAIPDTTAIVDAIKAYAVEAGVTFNDALRIILAANGGGYLANDPNDPTELIFYAPDGTTPRLTFALTTTTRTVA